MRHFITFMLTLALTVTASLTAFGANVPQLLNYQGYLADSTGSPLDTQVTINFVIYDDSTGGTSVWQQSFPGVQITEGRFQTLLGSDGSLDDSVFSGTNRFLGITVGADAEMVPRTRIVSVPYGFRSSAVVDKVLLVGPAADTVQLDPANGVVLRATDAAGTERVVLRTDDSAICIYGSDGLLRVRIGMESIAPAAAGTASAAAPQIAGGGAVSLYGVDGSGGLSIYSSGAAARGMADPAAEEPVLRITENGDIYGNGQVVMGTGSVAGTEGTVFGFNNSATGDSATVSGGYNNHAHGNLSTIGGGRDNTCSGDSASISGGFGNRAGGVAAAIGGGGYNTADGLQSVVCGGVDNRAEGTITFVGGGVSNHIHATGTGGHGAVIVSGNNNNIETDGPSYSVMCGGLLNTIQDGLHNFIGVGSSNSIDGERNVIVYGSYDTIASGTYENMVFGRYVYLNSSRRVVFYDGANHGRLGLNRDDHDGGISHPIHVGTSTSNGNGAHLTAGGTWTNGSSRAFKENFQPLDGQELLTRISEMQIDAWHFKDTDERHVGPVSEDFVEAFDVGAVRESDGRRDDEYLSAGDVAGVALAGVKELTRENRELKRQVARLEAMMEEILQNR